MRTHGKHLACLPGAGALGWLPHPPRRPPSDAGAALAAFPGCVLTLPPTKPTALGSVPQPFGLCVPGLSPQGSEPCCGQTLNLCYQSWSLILGQDDLLVPRMELWERTEGSETGCIWGGGGSHLLEQPLQVGKARPVSRVGGPAAQGNGVESPGAEGRPRQPGSVLLQALQDEVRRDPGPGLLTPREHLPQRHPKHPHVRRRREGPLAQALWGAPAEMGAERGGTGPSPRSSRLPGGRPFRGLPQPFQNPRPSLPRREPSTPSTPSTPPRAL